MRSDGDNPVPPVLAPVLPVIEGRLHVFTLVITAAKVVRGFLIPAILLFLFGSRSEVGYVMLFFVVFSLLHALVRYWTFRYRIQDLELTTRQGLLRRRERKIPFARIQDIRIEQGILHRLLGVVDVHIETAGGEGAEASFSVLARDEAERLRQAVYAQKGLAQTTIAEPAQQDEVIRRLELKELALAGLTSNRAASVLVILFALWQFVEEFLPEDTFERWVRQAAGELQQWSAIDLRTSWVMIGLGLAGLLVVGSIFSVLGSILLFHGFTLTRRGEDLFRRYGLLTQRASSLPRRRIQVVKIEETLLRRIGKLAAIKADTAGRRAAEHQESESGRDVLIPILPREQAEGLMRTFFADCDPDPPDWQKVSPRAIRRGTVRGAALCLGVAVVVALLQRSWIGLWPVLLIPVVYKLNVLAYRHLGFALGNLFWTRRGWLSRSTHVVPVRNVQAVMLRQTPFDRRHGVATLLVDTAGQSYTGGAPEIRNVETGRALDLGRVLAHRAANRRYRW